MAWEISVVNAETLTQCRVLCSLFLKGVNLIKGYFNPRKLDRVGIGFHKSHRHRFVRLCHRQYS